jgi:hypothetical protein
VTADGQVTLLKNSPNFGLCHSGVVGSIAQKMGGVLFEGVIRSATVEFFFTVSGAS